MKIFAINKTNNSQKSVIKNSNKKDLTGFGIKQNNVENSQIMNNSITPYRWYKIDNQGYPNLNIEISKTFNYVFNKVASFQKEYKCDEL